MKRVVVACAPERVTELAAALAARALVPSLAFNAEQFLRAVHAGADLAVVQPHVVGSTSIVVAGADSRISLIIVADSQRLDADVRALAAGVLSPNASPTEIATSAVVVVQQRAKREAGGAIRWGPLEIDLDRRRVMFHGAVVDVTPLQRRLLASLVLARGAVRSREELQAELWPGEPPDDGRRLDAHIRRVRARLGGTRVAEAFIITVRGEGFRLADLDHLEEPEAARHHQPSA